MKAMVKDIMFVKPSDVTATDEVMKDEAVIWRQREDFRLMRSVAEERRTETDRVLKMLDRCEYTDERTVLVMRPVGEVELPSLGKKS
jgi:hypothetical protein